VWRRYEAGKKEGKFTEEEAKREHAKHSLERYMHYYQRWNENDKSRVKVLPRLLRCRVHSVSADSAVGMQRQGKPRTMPSSAVFSEQSCCHWCSGAIDITSHNAQAQQKMAELQGNKLETLSEITATPTSQLKFITDAWCQVRAPEPELFAIAEVEDSMQNSVSEFILSC